MQPSRPPDFHVDQDGPLASQDAGEHGDALFDERIGRAAKSAQLEVTICDFKFSNSPGLSWNMKSAGTAAIAGDFRDITRTFAALIRFQLTAFPSSDALTRGIVRDCLGWIRLI
jgi:hypothetical protein